MKFRKKPVVIEATQFRSGLHRLVPEGVCEGECCNRETTAHIHTLLDSCILKEPDRIEFLDFEPQAGIIGSQ